MNAKETLKKLHETFPNFDMDTLLKILDCYVKGPTTLPNTINIPWYGPLTIPSPLPRENIIWCQNDINTTRCC